MTVKKAIFTGATNGFRIKSWARPSSTGFIGGVRLIGDAINNVRNPATIDEHQYCRQNPNCSIR